MIGIKLRTATGGSTTPTAESSTTSVHHCRIPVFLHPSDGARHTGAARLCSVGKPPEGCSNYIRSHEIEECNREGRMIAFYDVLLRCPEVRTALAAPDRGTVSTTRTGSAVRTPDPEEVRRENQTGIPLISGQLHGCRGRGYRRIDAARADTRHGRPARIDGTGACRRISSGIQYPAESPSTPGQNRSSTCRNLYKYEAPGRADAIKRIPDVRGRIL